MSDQERQPLAIAKPQIVITVQVGGQNHVYDIETAKALRAQLGLAIQSIEAPSPASTSPATKKKISRKKKSR